MKLPYLVSFLKTKIYGLLHSTVLFRFGFGSRVTKDVWEQEYEKDEWDFLFSEDEKAHNDAVIAQIKSNNTQPEILDIGCGHGALYNYFTKSLEPGFNYQGIDISETAIKKASEKFLEGSFKTVDYDFEKVNGQFNIIIFNEVLYYFVKPAKTLQKAITENLSADGVVIISMYIDSQGKNEMIWKNIDQQYKILAQQVVENDKGASWTIKTIAVK